jgi:hypothetical protein
VWPIKFCKYKGMAKNYIRFLERVNENLLPGMQIKRAAQKF